jgi:hypothetical protein
MPARSHAALLLPVLASLYPLSLCNIHGLLQFVTNGVFVYCVLNKHVVAAHDTAPRPPEDASAPAHQQEQHTLLLLPP